MLACKKCNSQWFIKNGIVAGKQRYKCKNCNATFREGDNRTNEKIIAPKALCILLYAIAKGSFRMLGRILNVHQTCSLTFSGPYFAVSDGTDEVHS